MIEAHSLTKHYGERIAVEDLSFTVRPGTVTGFLGPNGAGKSTTMRMLLGLDAPTSGRAVVNGRSYAGHRAPLHEVGAMLEARAVHTGRSAYHHLLALAATHGISARRVNEVIDLVGLPATVILDEPVNGLDPEGILWIRNLLKALAAEGRTVLVSSHLMSETALTAEHLIVIGRGRLIADTSVAEFTARAAGDLVRVRTDQAERLHALLAGPDVTVAAQEAGVLLVTGLSSERIGRIAADGGVALAELTPQQASLEEAFMELTRDAVEYQAPAAQLVGAGGEGRTA
ncbi:ABC transporter ATP-binding protein [Streptomyces triticisoli]|uniref:ABC transporter ATP-binding protein n=1 Tax=Streptomyces triticisoli TaxID=2182797 RepID=UPI000DD54163|nr:ATP-binding cassette domain-containing protein [Streptomyces triticisoli]